MSAKLFLPRSSRPKPLLLADKPKSLLLEGKSEELEKLDRSVVSELLFLRSVYLTIISPPPSKVLVGPCANVSVILLSKPVANKDRSKVTQL